MEPPPPGWEPTFPPSPEMGQLVCGSCHRLLSYPRGAINVRCSCCQTVNLVLEANQVGHVNCGNCSVLLMYPHGAPSVRCSSCHFVTKVGVSDIPPPLPLQRRPPPPPNNPVY